MIKSPPELRALTFELSSAVWSLAAIGVLFESGIGDQLAEPRTIDELAARCPSLTARRIEKLLAVAATHGVVVADGERWRLAEGVVPALCGPMRATIIGDIRSHLMQPLALLDTARGAEPVTAWSHTDPAVLQAQGDASGILPAMIKTALAPMLGDLSARLDRPGVKLLDVGTGVGALAIAACKAFPQLHVVGIDPFAAPLELARANVARAGVGDRVELRQHPIEDLRDEAAYALAWLPAFFIASEVLPAAIARVTAAIEPGGWLLMGSPGAGDERQRAINELVGDVWGGPTIAPATAEALLREAGLTDVRTMPGPPWAPQLVAGRRG